MTVCEGPLDNADPCCKDRPGLAVVHKYARPETLCTAGVGHNDPATLRRTGVGLRGILDGHGVCWAWATESGHGRAPSGL